MSMAATTGARTRAVITYYRLKYEDADERLEALRTDYIAAFEAAETAGGKTTTSFGSEGQTVSWMIGLTVDERLDALRAALDYYEGRGSNRAQARII